MGHEDELHEKHPPASGESLGSVLFMNEATALGAGSLAGSVCSLNQKSPLKSFLHQNALQ